MALAQSNFRETLALLCLWLVVSSSAFAAPAPDNAEHGVYVGNAHCTSCHSEAQQAWHGSHHDLAMQVPTADTVLGDFNNAEFIYGDVTTRFFRENDDFFVRTDNSDGELETFKVAYVFGVYPLQQLLLPAGDGKLQALSIAWDARSAAEGGQRWYHLYPDEIIKADDPLHWTGPYQNWNTRCADCHSTAVRKNYDRERKQYDTHYAQIDVGCEACHGPGANHIALAQKNATDSVAYAGFTYSLAMQGHWQFVEGESIATRSSDSNTSSQVAVCGRCHARRGGFDAIHSNADKDAQAKDLDTKDSGAFELLNEHRLATIGSPLYWPDGQIRDEVFVYGSFIQSKMARAGVVCSNCHQPHSNQLRVEGNSLCAQCHLPSHYDTPQHHRHTVGSDGAQCVACHMPAQTYMGVDDRRDHSMRIPRPDVSLQTGAPNACNQCHKEQSASWASRALAKWNKRPKNHGRHPALAIDAAERGDLRAIPKLRDIISDPSNSTMLRASAAEHAGRLAPPRWLETLVPLLQSKDALLRASAVRASQHLTLSQRYHVLQPLINDSAGSIRLEVAQQLAAVPLASLNRAEQAALEGLFKDYVAMQQRNADMPMVQMQLADFWRDRGDAARAERALREALRINPQLIAARVGLAEQLARSGRSEQGLALLAEGVARQPGVGSLHHALGLMQIRNGQRKAALSSLARAAELETDGTRHRYVYAVALHDSGRQEAAVTLLERLTTKYPGHPELLQALASYHREAGDLPASQRYQAQLNELLRDINR